MPDDKIKKEEGPEKGLGAAAGATGQGQKTDQNPPEQMKGQGRVDQEAYDQRRPEQGRKQQGGSEEGNEGGSQRGGQPGSRQGALPQK